VALGRGGALETVADGRTGVLVSEATAEAFADGLRRVERLDDDRDAIRRHALQFSKERFQTEIAALVADSLASFREAAS
jgi:glycosyltransferase involved in cell wall biosynthesis